MAGSNQKDTGTLMNYPESDLNGQAGLDSSDIEETNSTNEYFYQKAFETMDKIYYVDAKTAEEAFLYFIGGRFFREKKDIHLYNSDASIYKIFVRINLV